MSWNNWAEKMRMLVTGASSSLAVGVIRRLLETTDAEIWCTRHLTEIPLADPRLHIIELDLESDFTTALSGFNFDKVVHFAALTHAVDEIRYWTVNLDATVRLAQTVYDNGCRSFVYISTRCATNGAGAYGESKLAAERELQKLNWQSLLIIRPAEVYGGKSNEGIDQMLAIANKWRVTPALFGDSNLVFAPLHIDDFTRIVAELIVRQQTGVQIKNLCGPEDLTAIRLAGRISRRFRALPLPMWWPLASLCFRVLHRLGYTGVKPDQLRRLVVEKTGTAQTSQTPEHELRRFLID